MDKKEQIAELLSNLSEDDLENLDPDTRNKLIEIEKRLENGKI